MNVILNSALISAVVSAVLAVVIDKWESKENRKEAREQMKISKNNQLDISRKNFKFTFYIDKLQPYIELTERINTSYTVAIKDLEEVLSNKESDYEDLIRVGNLFTDMGHEVDELNIKFSFLESVINGIKPDNFSRVVEKYREWDRVQHTEEKLIGSLIGMTYFSTNVDDVTETMPDELRNMIRAEYENNTDTLQKVVNLNWDLRNLLLNELDETLSEL